MKGVEMFYLTSRHGDCGTNILFHNKNGAGYGTNLDKLHLFTLDEAQKELNHDIDSLPLLKSEVDKLAELHVDMQLLDLNENEDDGSDEYVVQLSGNYNGNDISFVSTSGATYDYSDAVVMSYYEAEVATLMGGTVWAKSYLDTICRKTFQRKNVNTRKMITGPGIVYKKPRKPRPTTGKHRVNCPNCGKINWQFDPYDFTECSSCYYRNT